MEVEVLSNWRKACWSWTVYESLWEYCVYCFGVTGLKWSTVYSTILRCEIEDCIHVVALKLYSKSLQLCGVLYIVLCCCPRSPCAWGHPHDHGGQHRDQRHQHHRGPHTGRGEGAVQATYPPHTHTHAAVIHLQVNHKDSKVPPQEFEHQFSCVDLRWAYA